MQTFPVYSDNELIVLIKAKNLNGFSILYDRYAPAIYGTIFRDVNDVAVAEIILQQCFINFWNYTSVDSKYSGHLLLWMLIIAKRATINTPSYTKARDTGDKD